MIYRLRVDETLRCAFWVEHLDDEGLLEVLPVFSVGAVGLDGGEEGGAGGGDAEVWVGGGGDHAGADEVASGGEDGAFAD